MNTRGEAFSTAALAADSFAAARRIPCEDLHQASMECREHLESAAAIGEAPDVMVEPTETVEPTDAIVEPTETVETAAEDTFELDDTLAQGLHAAGDVRPLRRRDSHGAGPEQQQYTDPMQHFEAGYEGGYEDDRAV